MAPDPTRQKKYQRHPDGKRDISYENDESGNRLKHKKRHQKVTDRIHRYFCIFQTESLNHPTDRENEPEHRKTNDAHPKMEISDARKDNRSIQEQGQKMVNRSKKNQTAKTIEEEMVLTKDDQSELCELANRP